MEREVQRTELIVLPTQNHVAATDARDDRVTAKNADSADLSILSRAIPCASMILMTLPVAFSSFSEVYSVATIRPSLYR